MLTMRTAWRAGCGLVVCAAGVRAAALAELALPRVPAPPALDGVLDDVAWSGAAVITTLREAGADGAATERHRVTLARDGAWLYAGFRVEHPVLDRNPPTFRRHDEDLQREDTVQVSFDPGGPDGAYYQFLLSPANVRAEWRMSGGRREREGWNIPWRSAARADDAGWSAELALPLGLLLEGGNAGAARLNVLVDQFTVERDACAAQVGIKQQRWSAVRLERSFDERGRFMRLTGLADVPVVTPFLPYLEEADVQPYGLEDGAYYYEVRAEVRDRGGRGGRVTLRARDEPSVGGDARRSGGCPDGSVEGASKGNAACTGQTVEQVFELDAAGTARAARMRIPVDTLEARATVLELRDAAGELWQTVRPDDGGALEVFSAYLDRDYYTGEETAGVVGRIGLPAEVLPGLRLRARAADGRVLVEVSAPGPAWTLPVPLAGLATGTETLAVELCRADGNAMTRQDLDVVKRAPNPAGEWKVDRVNRVLLRDSAPFFPFGFVMYGIGPGDDWAFQDAVALGANSVIHWKASGATNAPEVAADTQAYLDAAAHHDLAVIVVPDKDSAPVTLDEFESALPPEAFARLQSLVAPPRKQNPTNLRTALVTDPILKSLPVALKARVFFRAYEQQRPLFLAVVEAVKSAPNLIGYQPFDEPNLPTLNQDAAGRDYYTHLKAADGYHPVFVVYNALWDGSDYRERTTSWCDVLVQDPYWVPGRAARSTKLGVNHVAHMTARTKRLADSARRVTMTVPLAEIFGVRALLPAEQRCQTYLALIHGSKGLFYFSYPLFLRAMAETIAQLGAELRVLGPACLTPDIAQTVRYTPGELDPIAQKITDVQVVLRRRPEGGCLLLAANTADYPVDTEFRVAGLGETGAVTRLFGSESYAVSDHTFRDRIEGLGTRAYDLGRLPDIDAAGASNAELRVVMTARPERAEPEPAADAESDRVGRKNWLPNSSFEQASVPGWPDNYGYMGTPMTPSDRIGEEQAAWSVDDRDPYHGRSCLRMGGAKNDALRQTYIAYNIDPAQIPASGACTLSTWMRSNRDGIRASLYISPLAVSTNVVLTTTWQRYSLPFSMPAAMRYLVPRWYFSQREPGDTVWLDAAQLEEGEQATDYEP